MERALRLQDEALALLERLRTQEPYAAGRSGTVGGGRREVRRWPTPPGVTVELHDGLQWRPAACTDMGVGGARIDDLPRWVEGPVPARLKAPGLASAILVLADVMWRDKATHKAGLRFEFADNEEKDLWSGGLIDALLARHALA